MAEAPAGQRSPRRHLGQHAAGSGRAEHPDALAWPREGAGGARSAGAGGGCCRGGAGWGGQRTRGRCWVLCPLSLPCADSPLSLTGIPFYTHLPGVTAPTAAGLARCRRGLPCTSGPSLHLVLPFACLSAPDHHALPDITCYRSLSLSHVQQLARSMGPEGNDFVLGYVFSTQSTAQYIAGTWSVLFE